MLLKFEGFYYENLNGVWFFIGDIDTVIETNFRTEVKNVRTLERLKNKFNI